MKYPDTITEMLRMEHLPVVLIDQESIFTYINETFTREYGWSQQELIGKSVTEIMPSHMRSGHNVGFSRFLTTETSKLLGKPLPLKVLYKDGTEKLSEHYILGEKKSGRWQFGAIIDFPKTDAK